MHKVYKSHTHAFYLIYDILFFWGEGVGVGVRYRKEICFMISSGRGGRKLISINFLHTFTSTAPSQAMALKQVMFRIFYNYTPSIKLYVTVFNRMGTRYQPIMGSETHSDISKKQNLNLNFYERKEMIMLHAFIKVIILMIHNYASLDSVHNQNR